MPSRTQKHDDQGVPPQPQYGVSLNCCSQSRYSCFLTAYHVPVLRLQNGRDFISKVMRGSERNSILDYRWQKKEVMGAEGAQSMDIASATETASRIAAYLGGNTSTFSRDFFWAVTVCDFQETTMTTIGNQNSLCVASLSFHVLFGYEAVPQDAWGSAVEVGE